jgi:hypothetical protein
MFAISAADAISPAIQRTRTFLFRPFRLGTYLKLCLVALITEGLGGNSHFSIPSGHSSRHGSNLYPSFTFTPERIAEIVAASVGLILLSCFLYYLITRLRFAFFHCLIHNIKQIRPGWHLYRTQAARFFWLNLVVGLCFLLLVALIALPFAAGFWGLFRNVAAGGHPSLGSIFALFLPLIPIIFLIILVAIATDIVLRDLMLPHYALENATAGQAWAAVWARIKAEKGSFFAYALLRIILPIIALIGNHFCRCCCRRRGRDPCGLLRRDGRSRDDRNVSPGPGRRDRLWDSAIRLDRRRRSAQHGGPAVRAAFLRRPLRRPGNVAQRLILKSTLAHCSRRSASGPGTP